ncbi:hypothetical protein QT196_28065 [Streptomyces sp. P9-2B-2]|uniref:hypothetical protein n=1 Tax=Streptomyces TaxID=1883 RepID=UPI002001DEF5|nr:MULTISPECIES: hypothetical protein [Streptomyces]MCX4636049.1 hypothetical protein [Streptomyces platensis]WJY40824.1 hypothetical protein QT196_28065 [Streptomyces sp. P9-2B-2]
MMNEPPGSELSASSEPAERPELIEPSELIERSEPAKPSEPDAPQMRLLPWSTPDDRPCFLITDGEGGPVSDLADSIEQMQLGIGEELLRYARAMHADPKVPDREFRFLSRRLAEALGDALRVARN